LLVTRLFRHDTVPQIITEDFSKVLSVLLNDFHRYTFFTFDDIGSVDTENLFYRTNNIYVAIGDIGFVPTY